jgi:hypothetical protein
MNKTMLLVLATVSMVGCSAKSGLVYEDPNVAIYRACERHPILQIPLCRKEIINKKATVDVSVTDK